MKNFMKIAKTGTLALICVLFLGIGIKAEAAAPGQVTGLKQEDAISNAVQLNWTAQSGVSGYKIKVYTDAACTKPYTEKDTATDNNANMKIIYPLNAGSTYYVKVQAYSAEGENGIDSNVLEVVTSPGTPSGFRQTGIDKTKATVSWNKVSGANVYDVGFRKYGTKDTLKYTTIGDVASYSFALAKDTGYDAAIFAGRKSSSTGFIAWSEDAAINYVATLPSKITKVKIEASGSSTAFVKNPNATQVYASWKASNAADGYQYKVYGSNGKTVLFTGTRLAFEGWIANSKLTNKQFMKLKVRGYVMVNGQPKYGDWSDDCWFAKFPKNKAYGTNTYMTLQWDKIKGANSYTIKISTKQKSGYKKVGTFTKNKCTIRKCGKSNLQVGKIYYFKIIPNKKIGKKTRAFDSGWTVSYRF